MELFSFFSFSWNSLGWKSLAYPCIKIDPILKYSVVKKAELTEPNEDENVDLEKDFEQSLINSAVYIMSLSMQVNIFYLLKN